MKKLRSDIGTVKNYLYETFIRYGWLIAIHQFDNRVLTED